MADKKKGTTEGGVASGTKAPDKGAGKKAVVPEVVGETAQQNMAEKKRGTTEGGLAGGSKAPDKGAGEKAAVSEVAGETARQIAPSRKSRKIPKLAPKNKSRLPRREKKARQKGR